MSDEPIDNETNFEKPANPDELRPPNGDQKLSGCTLRQALESAYATFGSVLCGLGYPASKKLYEDDIPAMVFNVAVGAGWVDITEAALEPDEKVWERVRLQEAGYRGRKLILFGDLMVDAWYKEAFVALLEDSIQFHSYEPDPKEQWIDGLPELTSKEEREAAQVVVLRSPRCAAWCLA
jgi:hypothetical protein